MIKPRLQKQLFIVWRQLMNFNIYTRSFFKLYLELKAVCPFSFLTEIENISAGEEELRSYP